MENSMQQVETKQSEKLVPIDTDPIPPGMSNIYPPWNCCFTLRGTPALL